MKIKKEGFVYKVAYGLNERPPKKGVNICLLFWKFVFMLFVGWPIHIIFFWPLGLLVGRRPVSYGRGVEVPVAAHYEAYERWPSIGKWKLYPIYPLLASLISAAFYFYPKISMIVTGGILIIILAIALAIAWTVVRKETETGKMVEAYFKAIKEEICPFMAIE